MKKPRKRKCRICSEWYLPFNTLQRACSPKCAIELGRSDAQKQKRKELKEARQKLKTKSDWMKEAQQAFNAYIRERDRGKPCISCGRQHKGQYHAGHYRTTKACPELRFEPDNCHAQCAPCNNHLSGNVIDYRRNLISLLGPERLEWLEGPHELKRYRIEDLKEIRDTYRVRLKELKNALSDPSASPASLGSSH